MKPRPELKLLGAATPAVFWITTILCGFILPDYNHASRLVSELGALGTPTRFIFSAGLVACALLSAWFVTRLAGACRDRGLAQLPALVLLTHSLSLAGAGLFPLPLRAHLYLGMPSILILLSPPLALLMWRGAGRPNAIRWYAALSLCLMAGGLTAWFPHFLPELPGLKQRLFHAGWSLWFVGLGRGFGAATEEKAAGHPR